MKTTNANLLDEIDTLENLKHTPACDLEVVKRIELLENTLIRIKANITDHLMCNSGISENDHETYELLTYIEKLSYVKT